MIGKNSALGAIVVAVVVAGGLLSFTAVAGAQEDGLSRLSGYVYVDQDWNAVRDPLVEWVLPDIEILLTRVDQPETTLSTRTGLDGGYQFSGLDAGTYQLTQAAIPGGYLNVMVGVGELYDVVTGLPSTAYPGDVVLYDQLSGIMPAITNIELPDASTHGIEYSFGQLWSGKGWYLTGEGPQLPPGGIPPVSVPEPATGALLLVALALLAARRSLARLC